MKQITLNQEEPCIGRLIWLGALFGVAMLMLWWVAGPTPFGHALAWGVAILAALRLWRAIEGA
ncbi:MAG: hypothetical protein JO146_08265 [Candidatus Eremiobacteraeota bacterium]|nr:hypothetical protein [Candidatus Eremiobacteraeota bacterium]